MLNKLTTRSMWRGSIALLAFALPVAINAFPEIANLSIGAILTIGLHWLEKTTMSTTA